MIDPEKRAAVEKILLYFLDDATATCVKARKDGVADPVIQISQLKAGDTFRGVTLTEEDVAEGVAGEIPFGIAVEERATVLRKLKRVGGDDDEGRYEELYDLIRYPDPARPMTVMLFLGDGFTVHHCISPLSGSPRMQASYELVTDEQCVSPNHIGFRLECRVRIFKAAGRYTVALCTDDRWYSLSKGEKTPPMFCQRSHITGMAIERFNLDPDNLTWIYQSKSFQYVFPGGGQEPYPGPVREDFYAITGRDQLYGVHGSGRGDVMTRAQVEELLNVSA